MELIFHLGLRETVLALEPFPLYRLLLGAPTFWMMTESFARWLGHFTSWDMFGGTVKLRFGATSFSMGVLRRAGFPPWFRQTQSPPFT